MKRVVVTRSAEDVDRLAERLTSAGYLSVKLPLLAIEAIHSSLDIDNLPRATTIIIFTSVNAVRHGFDAIARAITEQGLVTIAVGAKSRDALGKKGVRAESPAREDSEGILDLLASLDQSPTHVVLVRVRAVEISSRLVWITWVFISPSSNVIAVFGQTRR